MTYVYPKSTQTTPPPPEEGYPDPAEGYTDPSGEYYGEFGDMSEFAESGDYAVDDFGGEPQGPPVPMTGPEMRAFLKNCLDKGQISQEEYQQRLGEVNHAVGMADEARVQIFTEIYQAYAPTAAEGSEDLYEDAPDVTSKQITDLMNEIKAGHVQPVDSEMSKEQCIATLTQALQDEKSNKGNRAAAEFREVLEAVGGPEAIDPKNIAAQQLGETPVSIDKDGTIHFDGNAPEASADLNLRAPDDKSEVVVDNATSVKLTPKNSSDEVILSEEGDYYVIQMGSDTFKVNKDAKLTILSDHVTGSVDNSDKNITVGANSNSSQNYVDPAKLTELSAQIAAGTQEIRNNKPLKWDEDNETAAKILDSIAAAMAETDPKKRAEAWNEGVADALNRLVSQPEDGGTAEQWAAYVNDIAQLVFNTLYDKLGEAGFKEALESGMIPKEIAGALATRLTIKTDENVSEDYKHAGDSGPGWTHQSSADFLNKYSGSTPPPPAA